MTAAQNAMVYGKMQARTAILGFFVMLGMSGLGAGTWRLLHIPPAFPATASVRDPVEPASPLPIPPVPPRLAEGEDYEHCMAMLAADPAGAHAFAEAWEATGGGDGARHCLALSEIELGDPDTGAAMLEKLAGASHANDLARAAVYDQAGQAWLMAGDAARAYAAASLALSLSPDDAELLIDRSIAAATLERYQDTIDDLDRALAIDPKRDDALVFRAAAWRHLDRMDRASDDIDHALLIDPDNADALLERGILRQRTGNRAGAQADWERAIALAPDTATGDLAQQNLALLEAGPATQ